MTEKQKNMCHDILAHYGTAKQEVQAIQELSELICVLARRKDQRKDPAAFRADLLSEITDCYVMIYQIAKAHDIYHIDIDMKISEKLVRQMNRIEEEKKHEEA